MSDQLTQTQAKALNFIRRQIEAKGAPPTLREICQFMGFNAIGSAQDIVAALRRKGFVSSAEKQAARAVSLTGKARLALGMEVPQDVYNVPCLGSVPAGNPLEAVEERIGTLTLSTSLLPRPRPPMDQLFAVRTAGTSMIDAGIHDGDWLVVKVQPDADPGSIVIARVGQDVTCKRLMHDLKKGWFLKPENSQFPLLYAKDTPFEIVGRVMALQRSLS